MNVALLIIAPSIFMDERDKPLHSRIRRRQMLALRQMIIISFSDSTAQTIFYVAGYEHGATSRSISPVSQIHGKFPFIDHDSRKVEISEMNISVGD